MFFQNEMCRLKQEMLHKCESLQLELNETKQLRDETQRKYDDVAARAEAIQTELEQSRKAVEHDKEVLKVSGLVIFLKKQYSKLALGFFLI